MEDLKSSVRSTVAAAIEEVVARLTEQLTRRAIATKTKELKKRGVQRLEKKLAKASETKLEKGLEESIGVLTKETAKDAADVVSFVARLDAGFGKNFGAYLGSLPVAGGVTWWGPLIGVVILAGAIVYPTVFVNGNGIYDEFYPCGETDIPVSPMFRWALVEDATSYDFQLATDAAFTNIIIDELTFGAQQTYVYTLALEYNTTYHWRVRATGGTGIDGWTTSWTM
jgi:hypothetical protein